MNFLWRSRLCRFPFASRLKGLLDGEMLQLIELDLLKYGAKAIGLFPHTWERR